MAEIQNSIESDIAELEHHLAEKKAALEKTNDSSGESSSVEKKDVHQFVADKIQQHQAAAAPLPTPPVQAADEVVVDPKDQVKALIELVFNKNLETGISAAVKTKNPAIIDAFHDQLVDELYSQLIEKQKLTRPE